MRQPFLIETMYTNKSTVSAFPRIIVEMLMSWKLLCFSGLCRHLETVTEVLHFTETFIRLIRAFWWLRLYNVPNLRYHDDHFASNNAALSSLRRNNRHPSFAFPRTKLVLRRYEKFKPYLVYRLLPCFLSHSQWTPAFQGRTTWECRSLSGSSDCLSDESECGGQITVNALIVFYVWLSCAMLRL